MRVALRLWVSIRPRFITPEPANYRRAVIDEGVLYSPYAWESHEWAYLGNNPSTSGVRFVLLPHCCPETATRADRMTNEVAPTVSVIVPCRNERHYVEACMRSILAQEPPPGGFEVIAADGMSDDGTREILRRLAEADTRLRMVDNPGRITPCAMNTGIRHARGQYIAIMGAHAEYAPDYMRRCVELLDEHPEVCCAGGPILSRGKSAFGRGVAAAMSHPVGVGNAKHRFPAYEGYAEGACFPVFRRETFDKVGLYDEGLVHNQDDELNYRVARSGGKIYISPRARCSYYVREFPSQLFWQYFRYGYWRVAVLRKHQLPASVRQVAPGILFFLMLILLIGGLCLPAWWRLTAAVLPVAYASVLVTAAVGVAIKQGMVVGFMFPFAAAIMHVAYAAGFLRGLSARRQR